MKKILLTTFASVALSISAFSQAVPSPFWATLQNTNFPTTQAGLIMMDVVDMNTVWGQGNYGANGRPSALFSTTSNGGTTWTSGNILPDTNTYEISNIEGIDADTAWIAAWTKSTGNMGVLYKTNNAGVSWTNVTPVGTFTNASSFADFVAFVNPTVGICLGDPVGGSFEIHKTINGGATWSAIAGTNIPNPVSGEYGLTNSFTTYSNTIWYGTNKGRVYRSSNAGSTWTVSAAMTGATDVSRLAFTDANNGLCIAATGTVQNLWQTTNGGMTWTNLAQPINCGFNDVAAIKGTSWFASVSNPSMSIAYSTDNGVTWNSWGGSGIGYLTIGFSDNATGWAGTFSDAVSASVGGVYKFSGLPLGIAQSNLAPKAISTYPNPNNGTFQILLPSAKRGLSISVTDALGNVVYSEKTTTTSSENKTFNLQHLAKGIYFVDMTSDVEKYHQKIVIQ
ncbi:MAG TPA: T9SS type A sorting domain-containing protein [Bacteroidia bacterium]|jgi:hypothetical protein|nr:T9SS type A sorting domain-containing protein [Bacteroidia bacterium]